MPRMARVVVPDYPHHVTQRGNRRQAVFLRDGDCAAYLALIRRACSKADTRVLAYCLMPNHVHFVLVPTHEDGLRAVMADAHRRYTRGVNRREGWRGHLWQERFHSFVMDDSHLCAAIPYIEENPVRAGLCALPGDWPWSSASAGRGNPVADFVDWRLRQRLAGASASREVDARQRDDEAIRLHTRTGRPLGGEAFVTRVESATGRTLRPQKRGRKSRSKA